MRLRSSLAHNKRTPRQQWPSKPIRAIVPFGAGSTIDIAGFNALHVPFKGGPEAPTQVPSGQVDFMSIGISCGALVQLDRKMAGNPLFQPSPKSAATLSPRMRSFSAALRNPQWRRT